MAGDGSDSKIKIIRGKLDKGYLCVVSLQADTRKTNSMPDVLYLQTDRVFQFDFFLLNQSIYVYSFFQRAQ